MGDSISFAVDWRDVCKAVEDRGYVIFPKDEIVKLANEKKAWDADRAARLGFTQLHKEGTI